MSVLCHMSVCTLYISDLTNLFTIDDNVFCTSSCGNEKMSLGGSALCNIHVMCVRGHKCDVMCGDCMVCMDLCGSVEVCVHLFSIVYRSMYGYV